MTTRRVRLADITLHVAEAGTQDGPLVVLLHGFPEFWWGWRHQIGPIAAAGFRVAVPDQRGYGLSDKPQAVDAYGLDRLADDVAGLVDALGAGRASLVGHDWGGLVAWWTALRHPRQVANLVILNAPHPSVVRGYAARHPGQWFRSAYIGAFQLPYLPELALRRANFKALTDAMRASSPPGTFSDRDLVRYREAWSRPGAVTGMLNWYRALFRTRRSPLDPQIRVRSLVIWGRDDPYLQPGLATASAALCQDVDLHCHEAGHWLHHQEPALVANQIIGFLTDRRRAAQV